MGPETRAHDPSVRDDADTSYENALGARHWWRSKLRQSGAHGMWNHKKSATGVARSQP